MRPRPLLLMGPTASGKSELALRLALRLGGEVVSVDSCAIYRGLDVGSAKPPACARRAVAHHLIDVRDPHESYSAGAFFSDARRLAHEIASRGRVPVLAGGTMMYFNCLLRGLSDLPEVRAEVRAEVRGRLAREGPAPLHAWLAEHDPPTASRLHPNDSQRIGRAAEVHMSTGRPFSAVLRDLPRRPAFDGPCAVIALVPSDTRAHNARIRERVGKFAEQGWAREVEGLLAREGVGPASQSLRSVGYRDMVRCALGEITPEDALDRAAVATQRLAKRQRTWLRSLRNLAVTLDPQDRGCATRAEEMVRAACGN